MSTRTKTTKAEMTTEVTPSRRKPRRRLSAIPVFATMAALFLATFVFLTLELIGGRDPALGAKALDSVKPERPVVVVRKVIKRKVITTMIPADPVASASGSTGSYTGSYSSGGATYVAPATTSVAPVPAPAPAPVVSSAS